VTSTSWTCIMCSLINEMSALSCEVCGHDAPARTQGKGKEKMAG
jgi:hypothetical protein